MEKILLINRPDKLYTWALIMAFLTVGYNLIEGIVSIYFGLRDDTLTLFGFGIDSFIETISAIGVIQMIVRIKKNSFSQRSRFEVLALKITGWCFYMLVLILIGSAILNFIEGQQPVSTIAGLIIAIISLLTMWILIRTKIAIGKKLNSAPIITDAKCNQVCLYMSIVLLIASGLWWLGQIPYIDILGTVGLIYFSFKEGREAFEKAKGIQCKECIS